MKIAMTTDELKTLTEDVVGEAINLGWLYDEHDEDASDVFCIVDRALAALGIDIVEYEDENEDEEDEDEDEDEEEDEEESEPEGIHIPWHEAERLMDFAAAICCFCSGTIPGEVDNDFIAEVNRFAREMFCKFCHFEGITHVDEEDE